MSRAVGSISANISGAMVRNVGDSCSRRQSGWRTGGEREWLGGRKGISRRSNGSGAVGSRDGLSRKYGWRWCQTEKCLVPAPPPSFRCTLYPRAAVPRRINFVRRGCSKSCPSHSCGSYIDSFYRRNSLGEKVVDAGSVEVSIRIEKVIGGFNTIRSIYTYKYF